MITEDKVTEIIFCIAADFCKFFDAMMWKYTLKANNNKKKISSWFHDVQGKEIMLIMILFHDSGYRCLKHFYLEKVCKNLRHLFPEVVSYNRFVELEKVAILSSVHQRRFFWANAPASVLSTVPLSRLQRSAYSYPTKVFKVCPKRKMLHGMVLRFQAASDLQREGGTAQLHDYTRRRGWPKAVGIQGICWVLIWQAGSRQRVYRQEPVPKELFIDGIQLITKLKSNMKGALMSVSDKLLLRKRAIIETVNDELKNIAQVSTPDIDALITSSLTFWEPLLHIAYFEKTVYQCAKENRHAACLILNSSNSRYNY